MNRRSFAKLLSGLFLAPLIPATKSPKALVTPCVEGNVYTGIPTVMWTSGLDPEGSPTRLRVWLSNNANATWSTDRELQNLQSEWTKKAG